jgi:hypothetical protein
MRFVVDGAKTNVLRLKELGLYVEHGFLQILKSDHGFEAHDRLGRQTKTATGLLRTVAVNTLRVI